MLMDVFWRRTGALSGGKSAVYMLSSVGERTPPCGTPV